MHRFETNYFGILNVSQHFMPLMRTNSRIVNLGSSAGVGALAKMKKELQEEFKNVHAYTHAHTCVREIVYM